MVEVSRTWTREVIAFMFNSGQLPALTVHLIDTRICMVRTSQFLFYVVWVSRSPGGDKGALSLKQGTPATTIPLTYIKKAEDRITSDYDEGNSSKCWYKYID